MRLPSAMHLALMLLLSRRAQVCLRPCCKPVSEGLQITIRSQQQTVCCVFLSMLMAMICAHADDTAALQRAMADAKAVICPGKLGQVLPAAVAQKVPHVVLLTSAGRQALLQGNTIMHTAASPQSSTVISLCLIVNH